jgi:hypothetical protein
MKLEFSRHNFENSSNIKFNENRTAQAEMSHADRQKDKTKPIVAVRWFANEPKTPDMKVVPVKLNVSWWNAKIIPQSSLFDTEDFHYILNLSCSPYLQSYRSTTT